MFRIFCKTTIQKLTTNKRAMSSTYSQVLKKHPILVQAVQSGLLMGTGDVIAQTFLEKTELKNLNILRTAQFFGIGFFIGVKTNQIKSDQ